MVRLGYKQTEVGEIPEDWDLRAIGDSYEFKNGLNKEKKYFGYGTPIINYMDVYGYAGLKKLDIQGKVDVTTVEKRAYSAKKGDVFFTRTSETVDEIGVASTLLEEVGAAVFSGFILRARPFDDYFDLSFQKYCFKSEIVRKQIQSTSSYTTRALTNGRMLSTVLVPVPTTKSEQKAIAKALSDVDDLIASLEKLIAKKRDIKTATMQQLLTGKKRLPGFGEGKSTKQTELGEIPEDWDIVIFEKIANLRKNRINPKIIGGGDLCIELEHIEQTKGSVNGATITTDNSSIKSVFSRGDVLFGKLRSYLRKYLLAEFDGVCSTEIWVFQSVAGTSISGFLYHVIQTDKFVECASEAYGTHMPRADWNVVKELVVALPDIDEQKEIADVLSDIDEEIDKLENRLKKTKSIKQGIMQELLTGRTRLVEQGGKVNG